MESRLAMNEKVNSHVSGNIYVLLGQIEIEYSILSLQYSNNKSNSYLTK